MKTSFYLIFFISIFFLAYACEKTEDLPNEPVINTAVIEDTDSLALIMTFTDGDGNFGLGSNDNQPPFQDSLDNDVNPFSTNLWLTLLRKESGEYQEVETPGNFNARLPVLTPAGQNKQLRVKLTYVIKDFPALVTSGFISVDDTVVFDVQIVDRDLNISPIFRTNEYVIPF